MSNENQYTITVSSEMANTIRFAVESGEYTSSNDVIIEALQDWQLKKNEHTSLDEMRKIISDGLNDIKQDHVQEFNSESIIQMGKEKLAKTAPSKCPTPN